MIFRKSLNFCRLSLAGTLTRTLRTESNKNNRLTIWVKVIQFEMETGL